MWHEHEIGIRQNIPT